MKNFTTSISPIFICLALVLVIFTGGCSRLFSSDKTSEYDSALPDSLTLEREGRFGENNIPLAEAGTSLFADIPFEFDSSSLTAQAHDAVRANARVLEQNPSLKVVLEGHCDERGTAEYNMSLGLQRARAVRSALISLGIESHRLDTISYGEEVPLDTAHTEAAWERNRRVHFSSFAGQ